MIERVRSRRSLAAVALLLLTSSGAPVSAIDCFTEIPPAYRDIDVRSRIRARTPGDVQRIRRELIGYIWKSPALPRELPAVAVNVRNPFPVMTLPQGARIDQLTIALDGFVTQAFLLLPAGTVSTLTIFHHGHSWALSSANALETVRLFLERRSAVVVLFPPLFGPNSGPIPDRTMTPAPLPRQYHDLMFALETPRLSPIKYFLEPVVSIVNYAEQTLGVRSIDMIGVSGGGWTTTLAAAIDPRIQRSIPVAGSLPLYLQDPDGPCPPRLRDREQYHPPLYALADYLDLYVLGADGRGRGQLQVLNQFDSCCFAGIGYLTYRDIVRDLVDRLGDGRFDVFLDSSHRTHQISSHALEKGIAPFLGPPQ